MTLFFVVAILLFGVFVFELYAVINATVHANRGKLYNYPLSIPFIKLATENPAKEGETEQNQSNNEHAS